MNRRKLRILWIFIPAALAAVCALFLLSGPQPASEDLQTAAVRKLQPENATSPRQEKSPVCQIVMNDYLSPYYRSPDDLAPFAVAALYEDGTVRVACQEDDRALYAPASSWKNIWKIWLRSTTLFGLDAAGKLHTTGSLDTQHLTDVADLLFLDGTIYAVGKDGTTVPVSGAEGTALSAIQGKTVIKALPFSDIYDWGSLILFSDGSIASSNSFGYMGHLENLQDVQDIFVFNQTPAAVQKDGTVLLPEGPNPALTGAAVIRSAYSSMLFAVTRDGSVTFSGQPSPMIADLLTAMPKTGALDIADMDGMRADHAAILYANGTVYSPTPALNEVVKNWKDIVQLNWYEDYDFMVLYGLRKDGTVIAATMDFGCDQAKVTGNYRGWELQSLHVMPFSGAIGITVDGNVVGDYAFEYVDLSGL